MGRRNLSNGCVKKENGLANINVKEEANHSAVRVKGEANGPSICVKEKVNSALVQVKDEAGNGTVNVGKEGRRTLARVKEEVGTAAARVKDESPDATAHVKEEGGNPAISAKDEDNHATVHVRRDTNHATLPVRREGDHDTAHLVEGSRGTTNVQEHANWHEVAGKNVVNLLDEDEEKDANIPGSPSIHLDEEDSFMTENGLDPLVTGQMAEEERRLMEERAKEDTEEMEKALRAADQNGDAKNFDLLDVLLNKTQIYSKFLLERMEDIKLDAKEEHVEEANGKPQRGRKRKAGSTAGQAAARKKANTANASSVAQAKLQNAIAESNGASTKCGPHVEEDEAVRLEEQKLLTPLLTGGILKSYQLKGVKWLVSLWQNGLNGILADQMGLGKTVQCIGFLCHLRGKGIHGPFLVCGPLSTLSNWVNEIKRFAPTIPCILYHGSKEERAALREKYMPAKVTEDFPVVVTSYEIVMNDRKYLQRHVWKYIVVDEGHRLKNFDCRLFRELKQIPRENSLLLTGTPLQNNLAELWALLNFILPEIFNDVRQFQSWFDFATAKDQASNQEDADRERSRQVVKKLHQILRPFLLRRLKEDVEKSLPPKKEIILYARMTEQQQVIYQNLAKRTLEEYIQTVAPGARQTSLNNRIMQLRKVCNHPDLIMGHVACSPVYPPVEEMLQMCGKLALLDRLLVRLKEAKHKVLIFSQMTRMLDILDYYLDEKGHHPCRLDGQVRQEVRQQQIADFNSKPETFVFLLSTRAGGLGINLTAADTVIIYDSDWNPHQDMQAMDRCHRIGQTKPVHVYRLATSQSVEGRMLAVAGNKLKLEKVVITKGNFRQESVPQKEAVKDEDVLELLKADESTLDDICQSCDVSDEDLARVLDRSDLTKTFDPSKTPPLPMKGPGWAVVQGGTSGSVLKSVE